MLQGTRPLTKRPRAFLACDGCKSKKSKCDGARPTCDRCAKLRMECKYTSNDRDKRIARRTRIARQNERQPSIDHRRAPVNLAAPSENDDRFIHVEDEDGRSPNTSMHDAAQASAASHRPAAHSPESTTKPRPKAPLSESLADVLATNAFDQLPMGEIGYFGSSTNHGFFWCLSKAIGSLGHRESRLQRQCTPLRLQRQCTPLSSAPRAPEPLRNPASRLSPAPLSTSIRSSQASFSKAELVARFFDTVGEVLPYLDERTVLSRLDEIDLDAINPDPPTQSWQALLNIVFAYALYTTDGPSPEPHYRRVIDLVYGTAIHLSTIQTMQALLLLSSFEQNIRRSMASLSSHSLAVRTAYHLGLHAPATYINLGTGERRLRARIWLAVVNQDRILSATLGRPCLIAMSHVSREILKMASPEDSQKLGAQAWGTVSEAFFIRLTKLHEITGACLEKLYLSNVGSVTELSDEEIFNETTSLSLRLDAWKEKLHPFNIVDANFGDWATALPDSENLTIVLSLHYQRTVLLVHGGLLMRAIDSLASNGNTGGSMVNRPGADMARALLKRDMLAARDLHGMVTHILQKKPGFLERNASWWICNYAAFTLSLHLFGLWLLSSQSTFGSLDAGVGMSTSSIETLLREALSNLRTMGGLSMLSSKAYRRLQRLYELLRDKGPVSLSAQAPLEDATGASMAPVTSSWINRLSASNDARVLSYSTPSLDEFSGSNTFFDLVGHQGTFNFGIPEMDYSLGHYDVTNDRES